MAPQQECYDALSRIVIGGLDVKACRYPRHQRNIESLAVRIHLDIVMRCKNKNKRSNPAALWLRILHKLEEISR